MASHRAELLIKLAAAQFELEAAGAELRQSGNVDAVAANDAGLADIAALRLSVTTASPSSLATLRAEIATTVAAVTATAQQARATASASSAEAARALTEARSASRTTVNAVMDGMSDFKLTFASHADEEAYRQREAERRAYIQAQQARHTPEGDLNASGGALGQMVDAKAHGAGDDPRFQERWKALVETTEKLRAEVARNGGSTKEFDERLRKDLRAVLKSKGLSDAQIDAQFAAHPDPLGAAKAYVGDTDVVSVRRTVEGERWQTAQVSVVKADPPPPASPADDPFAKLRSAGVKASDQEANSGYTHGVMLSTAKPVSRGQG